jgi:UDP-N-acetylglucosamine 2-epimerase (non-hydrolysing)/GDP/UDP-N,N'-diacetylbacillosamine 2-epimerase (hydrolysing)
MREIECDSELQLQLAVTGMHLSPEYGMTVNRIERDGFRIDAKVDGLVPNAETTDMAKSIGHGVIGFADCFAQLRPDLVMLLGDRFEILAAAIAAYSSKLPVAHIAGGDTTGGSLDEGFRHAITKMSHLHFATNELSAQRIRMMGERPEHVFCVGSPGLDYVRRLKRIPRSDLERLLDFRLRDKNILVTFHPATAEAEPVTAQFGEILEALREPGLSDFGFVLTYANADAGGNQINAMIDDFVLKVRHGKAFASLGQDLYLNLLAQVNVVVGNSSSGLYEAPSFGKPTVNIGDRQRGRIAARSVIHCAAKRDAIRRAIDEALRGDWSNTVNPYGDGHGAERIVSALKGISQYRGLLKKQFVLEAK